MKLFGKKESDTFDYDYENDYVDSEMAALDDDVTIAEEKLSRSIKRKEMARDMAVKDRVKSETDVFRAENKRLKKILKKMFRKAGRPAFCASRFYYALYAPLGLEDRLIMILAAIIALFAIPFTLIMILNVAVVAKVFIYIGICAFFIFIYIIIKRITKPKLMYAVICQGRPILRKIKANKKQIKKVTRAIKREKDDSKYDLEEFDNEITRNKGLYDVAVARKHSFMNKNSGKDLPGSYDEEAFARDPDPQYDERREVEFKQFDEDRDNKNSNY